MEHIHTPKVENVKLLNRYNTKNSPIGTLYLTTTHLIFVSNDDYDDDNDNDAAAADVNNIDTNDRNDDDDEGRRVDGNRSDKTDDEGRYGHRKKRRKKKKELWILHMLMRIVEKPVLTTSGSQIRILCWHFLNASFVVSKDRDAHNVYTSLVELSKPKIAKDLFCFSYNPKGELRQSTGWFFHDVTGEFQRMGIPNEKWTFCNLNAEYRLCPTYPKVLVVPKDAPLGVIEGSAKFRSRGRLPVLSYLHSANGAAIIRCAQPLVGISGVRSSHDESYVEYLRRATPKASYIQIIDTRPQINAMANKAGGKGYENEKFYEHIKFSFKGIDNIHKMRSSLDKLVAGVSGTANVNEFLNELCNSGWLRHIKAILECSVSIANIIVNENTSVIVHCSDGWDRTSQTCAIASLLLDPYYRTITGFQALIEKDWLGFGHKFEDRCGHISGDPHEISPIFTQFLDAVWQLTQMFPQSFQFNERYLITIHEHVYSKQYGTFFGNCEKQRKEFRISESTYSLWGYVALHHDDFVNPLYDSSSTPPYDVLRPEITSQRILFWSGLYSRFEDGAHPREPVIDLLSVTQSHTSSLEDHGRQLSNTISSVKNMISSAKAGSKRLSNMVVTGAGMTNASSLSKPPTSSSSLSAGSSSTQEIEKKFAELKTSIVEKCQSKIFNLIVDAPLIYHPTTTSSKPSLNDEKKLHKKLNSQDNETRVLLTRDDVDRILDTVAVEWKSWRSSAECVCYAQLEGQNLKRHCRSCGLAFCVRCIIFKTPLPGHFSKKSVPVCNACFKSLKSA